MSNTFLVAFEVDLKVAVIQELVLDPLRTIHLHRIKNTIKIVEFYFKKTNPETYFWLLFILPKIMSEF